MTRQKLLLSLMAVWISIFVLTVFLINALGLGERPSVEMLLVVSLLVCAGLATVGMSEIVVSFEYLASWRREFVAHALLGCISIVGAVTLAQATTISLGRISVTLAPFAILFGLSQMRIGHIIRRHRKQARALTFSGVAEFVCGVGLAFGPWMSESQVLMVLGVTACSTLLAFLPFLLAPSAAEEKIVAN